MASETQKAATVRKPSRTLRCLRFLLAGNQIAKPVRKMIKKEIKKSIAAPSL